MPRCPFCKISYPSDSQNRLYHPSLLKAYIRKAGKKGYGVLVHVGFYCEHCGRLFMKNDEVLNE